MLRCVDIVTYKKILPLEKITECLYKVEHKMNV